MYVYIYILIETQPIQQLELEMNSRPECHGKLYTAQEWLADNISKEEISGRFWRCCVLFQIQNNFRKYPVCRMGFASVRRAAYRPSAAITNVQ